MSLSYFITFLFIFGVSHADDTNISSNSKYVEEKLDDVNLASVLSILNKLEGKLDILEKRHDLEDNLNEKLGKLQKNILDKLEKYINDRSDSSEKRIYRKIDELENLLPGKIDMNIINRKLDVLNKQKLNTIIENNVLSKKQSEKNENATVYMKSVISEYSMEESLYYILMEIKYMMPEIITILSEQLDALSKKIADNLEENLISKLGPLEEIILDTKETLLDKFYTVNNIVDFGIDYTNRVYPFLKENIVKKMNDLKDHENKILTKLNEIEIYRSFIYGPCKTLDVSKFEYQPISIDDKTFNHVLAERDANNFTVFEMSLAIKAEEEGIIQLSPFKDIGVNDTFIAIDVGDDHNSFTSIRKSKFSDANKMILSGTSLNVATPGILSSTKYTAFKIKINDGTLELRRPDSESSPILRYSDNLLKNIKYIGFTTWTSKGASFMYDCPF